MRLFLVRHGETMFNREGRVQGRADPGLTELGRRQAQAVASALGGQGPVALYSSPLRRAMETAQVIGGLCRLPVESVDGLREQDMGELDGLPARELSLRYPEFMRQWHRDPARAPVPGGETLAQLQERAWTAVSALATRHRQGSIVAVSHHFAIACALCAALGLPLVTFQRLCLDLAAYTILSFNEGDTQTTLEVLNERCHLDGPDEIPR